MTQNENWCWTICTVRTTHIICSFVIQFENFHISFMCLDKKITITLWDKSFWLSYFFWANFCYNWWIFVSSSTTFDIRYLTHNLAASWWDVRVNLFLNRLLCTYIFLKKIMNDHLIIRITFALAIITNFTIMPLCKNWLWIIIFFSLVIFRILVMMIFNILTIEVKKPSF